MWVTFLHKIVSEIFKMGLFEKKGHGVLMILCFMAVLFVTGVWGVLWSDIIWVHLIFGGLMGFFYGFRVGY